MIVSVAGLAVRTRKRTRIAPLLWVVCLMAAPCGRAQPPALTNEWQTVIGLATDSPAAVSSGDGSIYCGNFAGDLWALAPDGTRKWGSWIRLPDSELRGAGFGR